MRVQHLTHKCCFLLVATAASLAVASVAAANSYYFPEQTPSAPGVYASVTFAASASLTAGQKWRWMAVADESGGDPVMHLSKHDILHEVAYGDDNCWSGMSACITYTIPAGGSDTYWVLVYAKGPLSGGSGDKNFKLYYGLNNGPWYVYNNRSYPLGGYKVQPVDPPTTLSSSETFETVLVNDGTKATAIIRFDYNGNHWVPAAYDYPSGVGTASKLRGNNKNSYFIITTAAIFPRATRFIRNDALILDHDSDGDGLGDNLEQELCTCPTKYPGLHVCGFDCGSVTDPRDTDGDGIPDYWETIGCETNANKAASIPGGGRCSVWQAGYNNPQYLPLWGANARHKDIFVEVDRAGWHLGPPLEVAPRFETPLAEWAAQRYSSLKNQNNPDGPDGINVHYDVDHDCEARDATHDGISSICGQMGGASIIQAGVGDGCNGTLRDANMARERWGLFHWAGRQYGSSGLAGYGDSFCFGTPADENAAHEMGHNFGLQHWGSNAAGSVHRKPNYVSLMSYSYGYFDASTGWWGQEANTDPHANFSDGSRAGVPLNPVNLPELYAYSPSVDISGFCEEPYLYQCSNGSVDWNRDGLYSGGGIRAYIGTDTRGRDWGDSTDMPLAQGWSQITGLTTTLGVGAALLRDIYAMPHVVVVANEGGDFRMTRSLGGGWTSWTSLNGPGFRNTSQPFAVTFQTDAGLRTFVFGARADGTIWYASIAGDWTVSPWTQLGGTPAGVIFKEVSATDWVDSWGSHRLLVVARHLAPNAATNVYYGYFHTAMDWNGWYPAQVGGTTIQSQVSPAVAGGPDGRYYMVVKAQPTDPDRPDMLRIYAGDSYGWMDLPNDTNAVWRGDGVFPNMENVIDRPAMLYRPHLNAAGQAMARGALWLYYPVYAGASSYEDFRFTWGPFSATQNNFGGDLSMGRYYHLGRWDTPDYYGSAVVDTGLNVAAVLPPKTDQPGFAYHPYADGQVTPLSGRLINDFDDHAAIRDNLCAAIRGCSDWCAGSPPCQGSKGQALRSGESLCSPHGVAR
jgi:hypothetical protein